MLTKGWSADGVLERNQFPDVDQLSVDVRGIHALLTQLRISKASGPDGSFDRVLGVLAVHLAPVFVAVFQQSLDANAMAV